MITGENAFWFKKHLLRIVSALNAILLLMRLAACYVCGSI